MVTYYQKIRSISLSKPFFGRKRTEDHFAKPEYRSRYSLGDIPSFFLNTAEK